MIAWAVAAGLTAIAAAGCSSRPPATSAPQVSATQGVARTFPIARPTIAFRGMCDASGAVTLGPDRFVVGDDEDNVLRVYDSVKGGDPLYTVDVSSSLDLPPKKKKPPETDIEAATRIGDRALWLTSHGLSSKGKLQPARFRFFATTAPSDGIGIEPVGQSYTELLNGMLSTPELAQFDLASAMTLPPKSPGGLNIEGMTRRPDGTSVLIGFRNPRPQNKALLVPLLNPLQLIEGAPAEFGAPILLDLGGLGVRSLSFWRGRYLIIAGAVADEAISQLYIWDGAGTPRPLPADLQGINPEAFVSRDETDEVMLLSDDGTLEIDGRPCKKLKDPAKKAFRGLLVRIAD